MAVDFDIGIIAGITEREGDHIYNSAVFISNTGELLGKHRKINLVPDVEDMYTSGTSVNVFDTKYGRIGIDICADNHMESIMIGEAMAKMGAKMILAPSSWAVPPERLGEAYGEEWKMPFHHLSSKFGVDVFSVSNIGPVVDGAWAGWTCIGNSIAITDNGCSTTMLTYGEHAEEVKLIDSSH